MAGEASIWTPRTTLALSATTKRIEEGFTATAGQTLFTITSFSYALSTGALQVFKKSSGSGLQYMEEGVDWAEGTTTTFSLVVPAAAGDRVVVIGYSGITGTVDVRDTDIYVPTYQAIRDYAGSETTLYATGQATIADGGESFFSKLTGASVGFYVDNNTSIIVPTGGDGSAAWIRKNQEVNEGTVVSMIANASLVSGDTVKTRGYLDGWAASIEPKGRCAYTIATLAEVRAIAKRGGSWVPDEVFDHTLTNGNVAVLNHYGKVSLSQGGIGDAGDIYAAWAAALAQDLISKIAIPAGVWTLSATPIYNKAVYTVGAGGPSANELNAGGQAGTSTTKITCTGSGISGIEVNGDGTEGVENVHFKGFSLWGGAGIGGGTSTMNDGILMGTGTLVTKSSLIDVHIRGFDKTGKFGLRFGKCLETYTENVYTQFCYYGMGNVTGDVATTIRGMNCYSRSNLKNGFFASGSLTGSSFTGFINEGNQEDGLVLMDSGCRDIDFFSYYSEANNESGGIAPITIDGVSTAPFGIRFWGGNIDDESFVTDAFTTTMINLGRAEKVTFNKMGSTTTAAGFMTATANTNQCVWETAITGVKETDITGNSAVGGGVSAVRIQDGLPKIQTLSFTRDISTATGSQALTGFDFTPQHVQILVTVDNTAGVTSIGTSDGTVDMTLFDNTGLTAGSHQANVTKAVELLVDGSNFVTADADTFILGGLTLNWTKTGTPTGTATLMVTAYG